MCAKCAKCPLHARQAHAYAWEMVLAYLELFGIIPHPARREKVISSTDSRERKSVLTLPRSFYSCFLFPKPIKILIMFVRHYFSSVISHSRESVCDTTHILERECPYWLIYEPFLSGLVMMFPDGFQSRCSSFKFL